MGETAPLGKPSPAPATKQSPAGKRQSLQAINPSTRSSPPSPPQRAGGGRVRKETPPAPAPPTPKTERASRWKGPGTTSSKPNTIRTGEPLPAPHRQGRNGRAGRKGLRDTKPERHHHRPTKKAPPAPAPRADTGGRVGKASGTPSPSAITTAPPRRPHPHRTPGQTRAGGRDRSPGHQARAPSPPPRRGAHTRTSPQGRNGRVGGKGLRDTRPERHRHRPAEAPIPAPAPRAGTGGGVGKRPYPHRTPGQARAGGKEALPAPDSRAGTGGRVGGRQGLVGVQGGAPGGHCFG